MEIIFKNITEIINNDQNAREHSDEQINQIIKSINEFGFNDPIEIGSDNVIISGHGRFAAALVLGMTNVPTVVHHHLKGQKRRAYALAANKIQLNSAWDYSILKEELKSLSEEEQNLTGFTEDELSEILGDIEFEAGSIDDQGKLDELSPKWLECPHCQKAFDARDQL